MPSCLEYFDGRTFLNSETGNFRGADNPSFPVSAESKSAGESISNFRGNGAAKTVLKNWYPRSAMQESVNDVLLWSRPPIQRQQRRLR
jgi:hypothetical protein